MNGRLLGFAILWFGVLGIVQSTVLREFELGLGSGLGLLGGLVLILVGLFGVVFPDRTDFDEFSGPLAFLFAFGVCLYTVGVFGPLVF